MEVLFPLALLAYLAFGAWSAMRVWHASRAFTAAWPRRLATSIVVALFFAPSLIPAGHGVAVGPAWMGIAAWSSAGEALKFVAGPIGLGAFACFVLWTTGAALAGRAVPVPAAAAPVGRAELVIAGLCAVSVPLLAAVGWAAQRAVQEQQREMLMQQMLEEQRADLERSAVGAWQREQQGQRLSWTLRLPGTLEAGTTLARVPESGYVTIIGGPGTVAPGTLISAMKPDGVRIATVTADAGGGFELELEASQGAYLSLHTIRVAVVNRGLQAAGATPATPPAP